MKKETKEERAKRIAKKLTKELLIFEKRTIKETKEDIMKIMEKSKTKEIFKKKIREYMKKQ